MNQGRRVQHHQANESAVGTQCPHADAQRNNLSLHNHGRRDVKRNDSYAPAALNMSAATAVAYSVGSSDCR